jgi:anti-anti-sigma factor
VYEPPESGKPKAVPFRVELHTSRATVRVVPVGELDEHTAVELEGHLLTLRSAGVQHVVLDLRRLELLDAAGVQLILAHDHLARSTGRAFTLCNAPPAIQTVVDGRGRLELARQPPA